MEILITGGAGFIGSHLVEAYLKRGHSVTVIDDLSTGSRQNLDHLFSIAEYAARLRLDVESILNEAVMERYVARCDRFLHFAAAVGVRHIIDHPLSTLSTNVSGTESVLRLCSQYHKTLFLASTSEVYGKNGNARLEESADHIYGSTDKSRWGYAASKLINEFTALAYHRTHGLKVVIGRLFNVVGPRQSGQYGMVIPRFLNQALCNEPITVYGDGTQTRTFTHVREAVIAITELIETPLAYGQVVNIGGPKEISIIELALKIKALTGSRSPVKCVPYEAAFPADFEDMQHRAPCLNKLQSLVGFSPARNIDSILEDVIAYEQRKVRASMDFPDNQKH